MTRQHTLASIGLTRAELTLIQTIIRLSSQEAVRNWDWVMDIGEAAQVDGLLVGDGQPVDAPTLAKARHLMYIGTPATPPAGDYDVMPRPIRAEKMIEWMVACTEGALENPDAQLATAAIVASENTLATTAKPAPAPASLSNQMVRLTRWPTVHLLQNNPTRVRMASLLSKQPQTAGTLSVMSGQHIMVCEQFLQELEAAQLLQAATHRPAPGSGTAAVASTYAPAKIPVRPSLDLSAADKLFKDAATPLFTTATAPESRSFFQSLRKRFGI